VKIRVDDLQQFKQKALKWASSFDVFCSLDSNDFRDKYSKFDFLLAVGAKTELTVESGNGFELLEKFKIENTGWITGFLTYDLKNEVENLESNNPDHLHFPSVYFFSPKHLIVVKGNEADVFSDDIEQVIQEMFSQNRSQRFTDLIHLKSRFSREEYIDTVSQIKQHISRGDIYVTNFCQEFYAENVQIDPLAMFLGLNRISPNPFSVFFKLKDKYILCASPERFLAKRGNTLISQPIKGTAKRYSDPVQDDRSKQHLHQHTKELQENVMIVDLVRNDLTRSAQQGSVQTEELFGLYSFSQVHQMISTIVCEKSNEINDIQAIKNTFPMGSMTGAPKISVMKLMEEYERTKRSVYSGAIGYFSPDGDFDFNVVIRTLLYNKKEKYLSFQVGGAITFHAEPEKEYEECMLKAQAILEVLGQPGSFQNP
jgi:para-aminobenzoate synthetase component 1